MTHARDGFPAAFEASGKYAPEYAGEKEIQCVAEIATELGFDDEHVEILWNRLQDLHQDATSNPAGEKTDILDWGDDR